MRASSYGRPEYLLFHLVSNYGIVMGKEWGGTPRMGWDGSVKKVTGGGLISRGSISCSGSKFCFRHKILIGCGTQQAALAHGGTDAAGGTEAGSRRGPLTFFWCRGLECLG